MWTLIPLLFPLFLDCNGQDLSATSYNYKYFNQLYKGNRCQLKNGGGEGTCVKVIDCPKTIQEIRDGSYTGADHCGYEDFDEKVCCAAQPTLKSRGQIRPGEAVCEECRQIPVKIDFDEMIQPFVYNGIRAHAYEFPYMAALLPASEEEAVAGVKYICGGTLISRKHVLTAAHCVNNIHGLKPSEVLLGTNDLDKLEAKGVQRISISRIIQHPEFKRGLNYHDIAILELEYPVKFTYAVYPTSLTMESLTAEDGNDDIPLTILGWGAYDIEENMPRKLLKAEHLKFVTKKRCNKRYANFTTNIPNGLDDAMICVRDPNTRRRADICLGDSGGPLLTGSKLFPQLVGVASFGLVCGGTAPGVYTSVYENLDWIEDQVWPNSD